MKNKFLKKCMVGTLVATMLLGNSGAVFATGTLKADLPEKTETTLNVVPKETSVQVNGEMVKFPDAKPMVKGGRTMVPYVAVMELLGAETKWDGTTKTVTATLGKTEVELVVGSKTMKLTNDGKTETMTMDAAPMVANRRTYVPVKFMAEAFDYSVGWDGEKRTAVIIDFNERVATADKDFSILGKLLTSESTQGQAYKTVGDFKLAGTMGDKDNQIKMDYSGKMEGIQKDLKAQMKMDLSMAMAMKSSTTAAAVADLNQKIAMDMRMDMETGNAYIKSPEMNQQLKLTDGTWLHMDIYKIYEELGIDIKPLLEMAKTGQNTMTVQQTIEFMTNAFASDMTVDTYEDFKIGYEVMKSLFGDQAFQKSGNTYTASIDKATILKAIVTAVKNEGIDEDITLEDIAELQKKFEMFQMSGTVKITEKADGTLSSYDVNMKLGTEEGSGSFKMSGDFWNVALQCDLKIKDAGEGTMTMKVKMAPTKEEVVTEIPAGSETKEYMDLMKGLLNAEQPK